VGRHTGIGAFADAPPCRVWHDFGQEVSDMTTQFTKDDALRIGEAIGIDWGTSPFDVDQYLMGLEVELEHGRQDPATNVTDDDEIVTGKIALAHLNEFPDYYTRLERMEEEARLAHAGG
jgi:hypothetical protein